LYRRLSFSDAALVALAAKLAGCVVARVVYGPGFLEQGSVAGDWNTARLMITIFWGLTTALSLSGLADSYRRYAPGAVG
jgi:hypothetical protein